MSKIKELARVALGDSISLVATTDVALNGAPHPVVVALEIYPEDHDGKTPPRMLPLTGETANIVLRMVAEQRAQRPAAR